MKLRVARKVMRWCVVVAGTEYRIHRRGTYLKAVQVMRRHGGWAPRLGPILTINEERQLTNGFGRDGCWACQEDVEACLADAEAFTGPSVN